MERKLMQDHQADTAKNLDPTQLSQFLEATGISKTSSTINDKFSNLIESVKLYGALQEAMMKHEAPSNEIFQKFYQFVKDHPEYKKNNLLHVACAERWKNIITFLIEKLNEDVNAINGQGMTPLMIAVKKGHIEIAEFLLEQPTINPNSKIKGNVNILHWCCAEGYDDLVTRLLEKKEIDLNAIVAPGYWPLFNNCQANPYTIALMNREFNIADSILEDTRFKPKSKNDLLMALITFYPDDEQQLRHVEKLLHRGVDPNYVFDLKKLKVKKNALDLANFLHLDHVVPLLK
jgi:hypothetical protein